MFLNVFSSTYIVCGTALLLFSDLNDTTHILKKIDTLTMKTNITHGQKLFSLSSLLNENQTK